MGAVDSYNEAEVLLALARGVLHPSCALVIAEGCIGSQELAIVKVALDLNANIGLMFTAIVEGWDRQRIIRQLY